MTKYVLTISFLAIIACNRTDKAAADAAAKEFITHIDGAQSVLCAETDTDGDGYVSCTVFMKGEEPMQIQCGSETYCINCARGCKYEPALRLRGRARAAE